MCTHYTLLRNARSKQRSVHVRNSEVCTFETAKCARSKQRSAHLRLATQVRAQILPHAEGALSCFSETARSKSRSRAPSGGLRGVRHVAGGWGKAPQPPARSVGSFLGVKAKLLRGRCASLDPHPPGSALQAPCAGLWRVFRVKGGSRGWCGPQPRRGEDTALDATGATQACRQGVGGALPPAPLPLGERPPAGPPEALVRHAVQGGTPCRGSKGRAAPWA